MIYYKKIKIVVILSIIIVTTIFGLRYININCKEGGTRLDVTFSHVSGFYENSFELQMYSGEGVIYYTLDGSMPNKHSFRYEKPILITDVSENENIHSMIKDVSTGFYEDALKEVGLSVPGYKIPAYKVDKATIIRAVVCDAMGNLGDVKTQVYFVGFNKKMEYKNMNFISIVTEYDNLFGYEEGIYVTGKSYDTYLKEYKEVGQWHWADGLWERWPANYHQHGKEWEKEAVCHFWGTDRLLQLNQDCGIRVRGNHSRGYSQKGFNIYARKEYDGKQEFQYDFWGNKYLPSSFSLFTGGTDIKAKIKDYVVHKTACDLNIATMKFEPCVLFLNGEYWGFYWLIERYDAEYLEFYYKVNADNVLLIKEGQVVEGEEEDFKYYEKMVHYCSTADLKNPENYEKVCELIDIDSYMDYYALMIYLGRCGDWPSGNYALWRTKKTEQTPYGDGKWRWMAFDYNSSAFGTEFDSIQYLLENDKMFKNMMNNEEFRTNMFNRIIELSETTFNTQIMRNVLDECVDMIESQIKVSNERFFGEDFLDELYQEKDFLKEFFPERTKYIYRMLE